MPIQKIGFVGGGNMATAMLGALMDFGCELRVSDPYGTKAAVVLLPDNRALCEWADLIVLAIKPQIADAIMDEIAQSVQGKPVLSIVAGVTTQRLAQALSGARVCRCMPNTPTLVGEGMSIISQDNTFAQDERIFLDRLLRCFGETLPLPEGQMAAATALSGSGPAYFFVLAEAVADAGVALGLARDVAYQLVAQTILGSGAMLKQGGHPAQLKDAVCSPGGTTIAALLALEAAGARSAMQAAVKACYERAKELE